MKQLLENLVNIGNRKDYSGSKQRSILMANLCALGGIVSSIGYSVIYFYLDPVRLQPVIWINLFAALLLVGVILLNDKQHYEFAAIWLMICLSVPVFITLRLYLGYRSGTHAFFILFSILPILIISHRRRMLISLLSGMIMSFYFLTYRYIPPNNIVSTFAKGVLPTLETINMLFVLIMILVVFYSNQQIIDLFESDLSDKRKNLEVALATVRKSASIDALTDILNRGHMEERINEELARGYRYGFPISLMMFDIDHFKNVNDAYGHDAGDHVLKMTANIVKTSIRETDTLGRWGGEEFMILLPYTHESVADKVARKLCHIIEETQHGDYGNITASFGVAQWDGIESFERLYKRLDNALYVAKEQGRNQVVTDLLNHDEKKADVLPIWTKIVQMGKER
jgi:diguanylate cyclase (GGDEF)-like protein